MIWLILILGLFLRLINLNQSLWLDEGTQVLLAQGSLPSIIFQRGADIHPPLSYILMHFWILFGTSEIWLRMLSVIFAVATVGIVYKLSSEIFSKKIGLLSAFLLSISPFHIYYSQEIRMYSEGTFFAVLSMYYFYLLTKKSNFSNSLMYVLSSTALLYTHYVGIFLIITQFLYLRFVKRDLIRLFLKKAFFILLLWIAWLPQFLVQITSGTDVDKYLPGWRNILSVSFYKVLPLTFFKFSFGRIDFDNPALYFFIATVALTVFGYVLYHGIKAADNSTYKLVTFWLILPILIAIFVSFKIPLDQPHRLIFVLPAYYILLAAGIVRLTRFRKIFFLGVTFISILGLGLYYFNPKYWREDWRGAVNFINSQNCQNCSVVFVWPESFAPYLWYKGRYGVGVVQKFPSTDWEINQNMNKLSSKTQIFLFEYLQDLSDPSRLTNKWLQTHGFTNVKTYEFRGVGFVYEYVKS